MKICQVCNYTGPAKDNMGTERVVELLTSTLVELGHNVVMKINPDSTHSPAQNVSEIPKDCDIIHFHGWDKDSSAVEYSSHNIPWVATIHGGGMEDDENWLKSVKENKNNIICISKFISDRIECPNYVHNCVNSDEFVFSKDKEDYFLWMAGTDWGESKGLFTAINLAKKFKFNLKIAGSGQNQEIINTIKENCDDKIVYLGIINGQQKAETLSKAKAVLNIGKIRDAFCLVGVEALMSGTPVIARNIGAHPEILNSDVAILCNTDTDILKAILSVDKIDPHVCRKYAHDNFNNIKIAKDYLKQYERIIGAK